jgi:hypothetical protein
MPAARLLLRTCPERPGHALRCPEKPVQAAPAPVGEHTTLQVTAARVADPARYVVANAEPLLGPNSPARSAPVCGAELDDGAVGETAVYAFAYTEGKMQGNANPF